MSLIEVHLLAVHTQRARAEGRAHSFVPTTWDPHAPLRPGSTLEKRMNACVRRRKLVKLRKFWFEDGDLQLELFPTSGGDRFVVCRVHSSLFAADSKSARRFIKQALKIPDRTVQVDYTDVDAADVVCMLDMLYHPAIMLADFEAPQWISVFKTSLHFEMRGLHRLAASRLEALLSLVALYQLGIAYQHRSWLGPEARAVLPKNRLTHPSWCLPCRLTPEEHVLFCRYGKWTPSTYVRLVDEPEIMGDLKRIRDDSAASEADAQPSAKRARRGRT